MLCHYLYECDRCDREFGSYESREQHYKDSSNHNICEVCEFDALSRVELDDHWLETRHRIFCQGCHNGAGAFWRSESLYDDHLIEENVCPICQRHFDSPSNLQQHKMVHFTLDHECYCCERKFTTYAGMIIHLESGACVSGTDIVDLNRSAAMCYQWKHYIEEEYRYEMLESVNLSDKYIKAYPYKCPTCADMFTKLSGLFQHVDSLKCEQKRLQGAVGKLVRWLENQHAGYSS